MDIAAPGCVENGTLCQIPRGSKPSAILRIQPSSVFIIAAFDRGPRYTERDLLLMGIARMRGEVIESFTINILGVRRQMMLYAGGRSAFIRSGMTSVQELADERRNDCPQACVRFIELCQ